MFASFTAVQAGPIMHLIPRHLISALRPAPRVIRRGLQLSIPIAVTFLAFPALAEHGWRTLSEGGTPAAILLAVVFCAIAGFALRVTPGPNEPDVHDRQLDVILALPFIGASVWLTTGWPEHFTRDQPLTGYQIIAATALLTGGYLLLAGTRLTARMRFILLLPLMAMPPVTGRPTVLLVMVVATIFITLLLGIARMRRGTLIAAATNGKGTKESAGNSLLSPAPIKRRARPIDAEPYQEVKPATQNFAQGVDGDIPEVHAVRASFVETGGWR